MAQTFVLSEADAYTEKVAQPLRTQDHQPSETQQQVNNINTSTTDKLKQAHDKSQTAGYFQSHPYSQMFTSHSLAVDEATLNNRYMKLIFGGAPDPETDAIHMAYTHSAKQKAEAPIYKENTLNELNPSKFTEGEQATKESLMKTFKESRQYYKGVIDSDPERAMKNRAGHELTQTTYYGKDQNRFHHLTGQHGHLQNRPDTSRLTSWQNLSSRTAAPDGFGGEVPLVIQNYFGDDPRTVPLTDEPRTTAPAPAPSNDMLGAYSGNDVDRFVQTYTDNNPNFIGLFSDAKQRKFV